MFLFLSFGEKCEFVVHTEHIVNYTVFSKLVNMLVKHTKDYITFVFFMNLFFIHIFCQFVVFYAKASQLKEQKISKTTKKECYKGEVRLLKKVLLVAAKNKLTTITHCFCFVLFCVLNNSQALQHLNKIHNLIIEFYFFQRTFHPARHVLRHAPNQLQPWPIYGQPFIIHLYIYLIRNRSFCFWFFT